MKIVTEIQQVSLPSHQYTETNSFGTENAVAAHIAPAATNEAAVKVDSTATKKVVRDKRKLTAFVRELAIIKAQCDAGMEPSISIAGTCYMSKRSHATVYRDIQKRILPAPIKIGRNSALPFAVVKAYAAGQLVGVAA